MAEKDAVSDRRKSCSEIPALHWDDRDAIPEPHMRMHRGGFVAVRVDLGSATRSAQSIQLRGHLATHSREVRAQEKLAELDSRSGQRPQLVVEIPVAARRLETEPLAHKVHPRLARRTTDWTSLLGPEPSRNKPQDSDAQDS